MINKKRLFIELYKFGAFMIAWALPSTTLVYVVLKDYLNWNLFAAYIGATIISGIVMYPFMIYTAGRNKK